MLIKFIILSFCVSEILAKDFYLKNNDDRGKDEKCKYINH